MVKKLNKILVVAKDNDIINALPTFLFDYCSIIKKESAKDALDVLKDSFVDVVIADYDSMDTLDFNFLEKCYKINHLNTRLLVTENENFYVLLDAINNGNIYSYIKKSCLSEELPSILKSAIEDNSKKKENNQLIYDLKKLLRGSIDSIISALDAKDSFTLGRSHRVKFLTQKMSTCFEFSQKEQGELELAGLLHDIGMIGIPESILNKQGALTEEEFEIVKTHIDLSIKIIGDVKQLKGVSKIIESHHERFNGRGYPKGLIGKEIPIGSKIIAIADAYDSMVSKRAYRESLSHQEAMQRIEEQRGHQFDPNIVDCFCRIIGEAKNEVLVNI